MIKLFLENGREVADALHAVAAALGVTCSDAENGEIILSARPSGNGSTVVQFSEGHACIAYGNGLPSFLRALAKLTYRYKKGEKSFAFTETPVFCKVGTMLDVSRNAVMNVETVKEMLVRTALMGMNTFMLYTEDTYELEGYPYFGYMRGRYTKEEMREMDAFALTLGVELIPCIQTLGHLATHLAWPAAAEYKDTANALLVGEEKTYEMIDRMLQTVSECFTTRRVHLGLDETRDIGTGKYLERNGYRDRAEILSEHIDRVTEMAKNRGLEPIMWSDMFFRLAGRGISGYRDYDLRVEFDGKNIKKPPEGITQVFWDYYHDSERFYAENIEKHRKYLDSDPIFGGAVWTFSGHGPLYALSLQNTLPALNAAKACGTREVLATVWHSGSEGSLVLSLPGLAWYADYAYTGQYGEESVAECFGAAVGEDYASVLLSELPEHPDGGRYSLSRALLYNDPLLGMVDAHIGELDMMGYYRTVSEKLDGVTIGGFLLPAFDVIRALSRLLVHKADFGKRLTEAYLAGDRVALAALMDECDVIADLIDTLAAAHKKSWMKYNKPFGWEVHDIRYGGLKARMLTARDRIRAYLDGSIERIDELCEERLRITGKSGFDGIFLSLKYQTYATPNIL